MLFSNVYNHLVKLSNKMACESTKCYSTAIHTTIIVVLSLQLLGTIEKQVFDFLGYMWAPILGNFFQIICTILGIFGTCQYRPKFIAVYSTWSLIWLGWNIFVICLYLEVGVLNRNKELYILTMGTKSKSWWLDHGIGCRVNNESWVEEVSAETGRPIPPEEFVEGCILAYYYVEVIHAAVQCLLALTGFVFTLLAIYIYAEEPETSKYPVSARTYISPKDYPSTHYTHIGAVQRNRGRDSGFETAYVTYDEAMKWAQGKPSSSQPSFGDIEGTEDSGECLVYGNQSTGRGSGDWNAGNEMLTGYGDCFSCDGQTVINIGNQSGNTFLTKGGDSGNQTGSARMRSCESGGNNELINEQVYIARGGNPSLQSFRKASHSHDEYASVSPV
ncbi:uncharacterized protein LOC128206517 isoform X1 [Mya arenaria]|uniref:uncharacterized protein LOC128206517 isoform X1 n=1 Tax=Mya arenaria TaxID=6604 RepID=UPI0022E39AE4|nr:uncharacterized protein LOC128206517 isoform X1 [Mya arenaria]